MIRKLILVAGIFLAAAVPASAFAGAEGSATCEQTWGFQTGWHYLCIAA